MGVRRQQLKEIFRIYWPIAISWMIIGLDNPVVTAGIGRFADAENCLAAHGGVTHLTALLIEAPVCMLLPLSIAFCSRKNYQRIRKLTIWLSIMVTFFHVLITVPPVFDLVIMKWVGAPEILREYIHSGLLLYIPYSAAVAIRRFNQGILIRNGRSIQVTRGTFVRMASLWLTLIISYLRRDHMSGAAAGAAAINNAVVAECIFSCWVGRKAIRECILSEPAEGAEESASEDLTSKQMLHIAVPLVLTELLTTLLPFLGSGAMSRMPMPVASLAVYPAVYYVAEFIICIGLPLNEVSLAVYPRKEMRESLFAFVKYTILVCAAIYLAVIVTPLRDLIFTKIFSFTGEIAAVSRAALPLLFFYPLFYSAKGYYSAILMEKKNTRPVFEALILYELVVLIAMGAGIYTQRWIGVKVMFVGMTVGSVVQTLWMWYRSERIRTSGGADAVTE